VGHGFLRAPDGSLTIIDVPGAVIGTFASAINPEGAITGYYGDASSDHGFLRAPDGSFTAFDAPGSAGETDAFAINPEGVITGFFLDENSVTHGFVRDRDGSITSFDPWAHFSPIPKPLTRRGRSRDGTKTRASRFTASCGTATAP
jgi:hypothetical protein